MKSKGGMYCERCDKPVLAIGNSTWMFGAVMGAWKCPDCGGMAISKRMLKLSQRAEAAGTASGSSSQVIRTPKPTWSCVGCSKKISMGSNRCPECEQAHADQVSPPTDSHLSAETKLELIDDHSQDFVARLATLAQLRESQAISEEEFASAKARILAERKH